MNGPTSFPGGFSTGFSISFRCLTGRVVPAEQVGFLQRGTHRLLGANGQVMATLRSDTVNLNALVGQPAIVCGIDEGEIEGVTSLNVTQAAPFQTNMMMQPMPFQFDVSSMLQSFQSIWMP
jgi:hypothetical protein